MPQAHPACNEQYSRPGKADFTFFVRADSEPKISAALADAGFGCSHQEGVVEMLKDLLIQQERNSKSGHLNQSISTNTYLYAGQVFFFS